LFRKEEFNLNSENEFFDFSLESAFRGEKGVFNELLSDGGSALEFLVKNDLFEGTKDAFPGNTIMFKELTIFNGEGGKFKVVRNITKISKSAVLIFIKGKKKGAMAIIDFGRESGLAIDKIGGFRQIFENKPVEKKTEDGEERQKKILKAGGAGFG